LYVVELPGDDMKNNPERTKAGIKKSLAELIGGHAHGSAVRYRVEIGNVPMAILRVATEIDSDFIVLGVRSSSGVLDRFMWPIAYELVRAASCPVLTIRGSAPPLFSNPLIALPEVIIPRPHPIF
jgi:nucleotide-binding universal stress UspA family protein